MKKTVVSLAMSVAIVGMAALPASAKEYEVVKGDSLWQIGQEHQISVNHIKKTNQLDTDIIYPEQMLQLDIEEQYVVEKGDTLSEIALDYQVKVDDLKDWNELTSDLILIGQELTIKSDVSTVNVEENQQKEETVEQDVKVKEADKVETKAETTETSNQQLTMTATAYTAECTGCSGVTATGIDLNNDRDKKVIAVDPSVIPLGTKVHVEGYGEAIAGDVGGAIKGNKIDIHVPTKDEAFQWGVKSVQVTILD
ncbi:3D domain-containing protein [Aquibacillus saliphilus]|uniref:3D domain-containing protein n=1 Tax=Aquibacillus saliphilus TaxID=1909422 RepID=UPI001CF0D381|nr:3D domain-containing protein [Aquibacillus saliphilus]